MTISDIRPATSVVILRDNPDRPTGNTLEMFIQHRADTMTFGGGTVAFPCGGAEVDDAFVPAIGNSDRTARITSAVALSFDDLNDWLTAVTTGVRDVFEETGLLLGCDKDIDPDTLAGMRAELTTGSTRASFADMAFDLDLSLSDNAFRPLARWTTPEGIGATRRYNTTYLATILPDGSPEPDGNTSEAVTTRWVSPAELLDEVHTGKTSVMPVIFHIVDQLSNYNTIREFTHGTLPWMTSVCNNRLVDDPGMIEGFYLTHDINGKLRTVDENTDLKALADILDNHPGVRSVNTWSSVNKINRNTLAVVQGIRVTFNDECSADDVEPIDMLFRWKAADEDGPTWTDSPDFFHELSEEFISAIDAL